jgi:hypothetical protein
MTSLFHSAQNLCNTNSLPHRGSISSGCQVVFLDFVVPCTLPYVLYDVSSVERNLMFKEVPVHAAPRPLYQRMAKFGRFRLGEGFVASRNPCKVSGGLHSADEVKPNVYRGGQV